MSPRCVIVAGPNGAGKSTVAGELVNGLHRIGRYVNADSIAEGMAGFAPAVVDRRAGRVALETIDRFMAERTDFAFETTLSGRRWPRLLDSLEAAGYLLRLYYLWLPTADLAVARVRYRVDRGGHAVPEEDVRRRYVTSLRNLFDLWMPRVDSWQVLDASRLPDVVWIASGGRGLERRVSDSVVWSRVVNLPESHSS